MADNFETDAGSGGKTFASDDISSVHYPRCKISLGADGSAADALGGTGVDGAGVQRVSLATNVPLPAGTNAIGSVSLSSGSINGSGAPTIDSYAHIAINLTSGNNQELVAAPGESKQIWVYGVGFACGSAGVTVSFQDEDDTAVSGVMPFAQYGGLNSPPCGNFAMPMWKLATNKALEVDITGGDVDGWLSYAVVSV